MSDLEKIDEMFEQVMIKANATFDYNYFKYTQDILDIWDYVREQLGKPKFQRIVYDEYRRLR